MFANSTLEFMNLLYHYCYSCIVAFLERHSCASLYSIFTCIVLYWGRSKKKRPHKIILPQCRLYAILNMRGNVLGGTDSSLYPKY